MEALLSQRPLPLPPEIWSKNCEDRLHTLAGAAELVGLYEDVSVHPAWQHFQGILEVQRQRLLKGIREGKVGPGGEDLTPAIRLCLTFVENLISFPAAVKARLHSLEQQRGRKL